MFPFKSGADFYNCEGARLRLHNLGADPTEVGSGLIYYNTSTGLNTSQRVRIYTPEGFKSLAFYDEIANNEEFNALKEKVDLILGGEIDADGIIENWKEVEAFLEGISDTQDLVTLLNSKLDISGGTMASGAGLYNPNDATGRAAIAFNSTYNGFGSQGFPTYIRSSVDPTVIVGSTTNTLLHSGNIGDYHFAKNINNILAAMPDIDATINGLYGGKLYGAAGTFPTASLYKNGPFLTFGYDGFSVQIVSRSNKTWMRTQEAGVFNDWKTIAFTDSTVAAANVLMSTTGIQYSYNFNTDKIFVFGNGVENYKTYIDGSLIALRYGTNNATGFILNSSGNVTIGSSDLAGTSAKLYVDGGVILPNGSFIYSELPDTNKTKVSLFGLNANNMLLVGYGIKTTGATRIYGTSVEFAPNGTATKMLINSSGYVGIGTTEPLCALEVAASHKNINATNIAASANFFVGRHVDDGLFIGHDYTVKGSWIQSAYYGTEANPSNTHTYNLLLNPLGGNVGIGTTAPEEKLHVVGNLYVTGNIIADGELSAGGAGEEGTGGSGSGAFYQTTFTPSSSTSVTVTHNLGTEDIVITLYELDSESNRWSMCLTDIEIVDSNNIAITFGSTSSVQHKVVVMGGVA